MRISAMALTAALALAGPVAAAHAQEATTSGELITEMCYVGHGDKGHGDSHAACALKCATEGYPLALLTKDGTLYKIVGPLTADKNAAIRELVTKMVVVKGDVADKDGAKIVNASSITPVPAPKR